GSADADGGMRAMRERSLSWAVSGDALVNRVDSSGSHSERRPDLLLDQHLRRQELPGRLRLSRAMLIGNALPVVVRPLADVHQKGGGGVLLLLWCMMTEKGDHRVVDIAHPALMVLAVHADRLHLIHVVRRAASHPDQRWVVDQKER